MEFSILLPSPILVSSLYAAKPRCLRLWCGGLGGDLRSTTPSRFILSPTSVFGSFSSSLWAISMTWEAHAAPALMNAQTTFVLQSKLSCSLRSVGGNRTICNRTTALPAWLPTLCSFVALPRNVANLLVLFYTERWIVRFIIVKYVSMLIRILYIPLHVIFVFMFINF